MSFASYLRLNLSVRATSCDVIRATRRIIHKTHRTGPATRDARHRLYSQMLTYHRGAQRTFIAAQTGDFTS